MRRPFQHDGTATLVGGALVVGGFLVWYAQFEGSGGQTPWWLRWLTVW